jgi:hypothetical protein
LVNNQCTNIPSCPQGAQWNAVTSACQCLTQGHFIINNVCAPCPANSQWNGTACQCQSGFVLSGNSCIVSCAVGSTWNGQSCVCQPQSQPLNIEPCNVNRNSLRGIKII